MAVPELVFSPPGEPPFTIDALVEEEDSYLSLSAEPVVDFTEKPVEHPVRVMTAARDAEEVEPGTVVVRQGHPLRLLAVIHRLHVSPTWREPWVVRARSRIFAWKSDGTRSALSGHHCLEPFSSKFTLPGSCIAI